MYLTFKRILTSSFFGEFSDSPFITLLSIWLSALRLGEQKVQIHGNDVKLNLFYIKVMSKGTADPPENCHLTVKKLSKT